MPASRPGHACAPRRAGSPAPAAVPLGGRVHVEVDDEIAATGAAQPGDPTGRHGQCLVGLGAGLDLDGLGAVERLELDRRAQCRRGHGQCDRAVQVVPAPREHRVRPDGQLDVEIAWRAAAGPDLALARELDAGARVDTGRDLDGEVTAGADPAVTRALDARPRVVRAEPVALRTWPRSHDLAEERALDLADLAPARTGRARDELAARGRTGAVAGTAHHRGVDLELFRRP